MLRKNTICWWHVTGHMAHNTWHMTHDMWDTLKKKIKYIYKNLRYKLPCLFVCLSPFSVTGYKRVGDFLFFSFLFKVWEKKKNVGSVLSNRPNVYIWGVSRGRVFGCGCMRWWQVTCDMWYLSHASIIHFKIQILQIRGYWPANPILNI